MRVCSTAHPKTFNGEVRKKVSYVLKYIIPPITKKTGHILKIALKIIYDFTKYTDCKCRFHFNTKQILNIMQHLNNRLTVCMILFVY